MLNSENKALLKSQPSSTSGIYEKFKCCMLLYRFLRGCNRISISTRVSTILKATLKENEGLNVYAYATQVITRNLKILGTGNFKYLLLAIIHVTEMSVLSDGRKREKSKIGVRVFGISWEAILHNLVYFCMTFDVSENS